MPLRIPRYTHTAYPWLAAMIISESGCGGGCGYCPDPLRLTAPIEQSIEQWVRNLRAAGQPVNIIILSGSKAVADACCLVEKLVAAGTGSVMVTLGPGALATSPELISLKQAGASGVCFSLATCTQQLDAVSRPSSDKGSSWWRRCWQLAGEAVGLFGQENVGISLSLGLGETEAQALASVQKARDMGIHAYISPLVTAGRARVSRGKFYRVQVGRYLIDRRLTANNQMQFGDFGQVIHFGVDTAKFVDILAHENPLSSDYLWLDCTDLEILYNLADWCRQEPPGEANVAGLIQQLCQVDWREAWLNQRRVFEVEGVNFDDEEIEAETGSIYKLIAELGRAGR